jgi:elongation factor Ts
MEVSRYELIEAAMTFAYIHPGNRLATIVGFNMDKVNNLDNVGKEIAMQIAAMNPVAIDKDDVDPAIIEKEKEIGREQARQEGKPEEMLDKIALGKLNKFFKDNTLLNQDFVRDTKKTVGQYLIETDKKLKIVAFRRLMLGA